MNDSKTIQEAATQPLFLCPICLKKVHKIIRFNLSQRYKNLLETTKEIYHAVSETAKEGKTVENEESKTSVEQTQVGTLSDHIKENGSACAAVMVSADVKSDQSGPCFHSNDSHHLHRFEAAIGWLEKAVHGLTEFEKQWIVPGKVLSKSKVI